MLAKLTSILFLASPICAQTVGGDYDPIWRWEGEVPGDRFGGAVAGAGDVNCDGVPDVVIGARLATTASGAGSGKAYVYSGLDGSLIHQWDGDVYQAYFGFSVDGAGDVNGDGFQDLIIGGPASSNTGGHGVVSVFSGIDGAMLYRWTGDYEEFLGWSVSGAGDVNQDGYDDLLIGAHAYSAYLRSGLDGSIIYQWTGDYEFGLKVSNAGDVNNDGVPDAIVGDISSGWPGGWFKGSAHVFSGADGQLLYKFDGLDDNELFGSSVSGAGDVNQDGFDDVVVGSAGSQHYPPSSARVFSGADGSLLFQWSKSFSASDYFGTTVASAGDFSGDGYPDIIYCNLNSDIYSGYDGSLLHSWKRDLSTGISLSRPGATGVGDVNQDGLDDFIIRGIGSSYSSAFVYGVFNPLMSASTNEISISTGGIIQLDMDFPEAAANYEYRVLASSSGIGPTDYGVAIPLTFDPLVQRSWMGTYPGAAEGELHGTLDSFGDAGAMISITTGNWPELVGMDIYIAAVAMTPGELPEFSSVAVQILFLP